MIDDYSEVMSHIQKDLQTLDNLCKDKRWSEAKSKCSQIEEDVIKLWHWLEGKENG